MALFGEGGVTRLRREFKLVLSEEAARALCTQLEEEAQAGGGLHPVSLITSVYFDRPDLELSRRAQERPEDCLKVRTKEYFPDLEASSGQRVVLEVKRERNGLTRKRRVWVERPDLPWVLHRGTGLVPRFVGSTLEAQLAVTYRRRVFQREAGWRVTVDDQLQFHRVTQEQALSPRPLERHRLEAPFAVEPRMVVEVKHSADVLPGWLCALEAGSARRFSKFGEGMARLLQLRRGGVAVRGG